LDKQDAVNSGTVVRQCLFQRRSMDITRIVQRTFAGYGIETAGISITDVLDFPGQGGNCLTSRQSDNSGKYIPGGPARRTSFDLNTFYYSLLCFNFVFRQSKLFAVFASSLQASQPASGKGRKSVSVFFAGGNNRDLLFFAHLSQMAGQIRMFQKVQHKISLKIFRDVSPRVINDFRQCCNNIASPNNFQTCSMAIYALDFFLA